MECLYIIEGERGLFKAGRTSNFEVRLRALSAEFKRHGDAVSRHLTFEGMPNAWVAERDLLERLVAAGFERHHGSEWFRGVDFSEAARLASRSTRFGKKFKHAAPVRGEAKAYRERYRALVAERKGGPEAYQEWIETCRYRKWHEAVLRESGARSFGVMSDVLARTSSESPRRIDHHPV